MWLSEVLVFFLCWNVCVAQVPMNCSIFEVDSCLTYRRLVCETITSQGNQFNMQNAFFPADTSSPVYIIVNYDFVGSRKTFYWSASTFFSLFHPLPVYQFTSLFFGDYEFRKGTLNLTLPTDCASASDDNLQFLTQRVCRHFSLSVL